MPEVRQHPLYGVGGTAMMHVGSIAGIGRIELIGTEGGSINYSIDVYKGHSGTIHAGGRAGGNMAILTMAFDEEGTILNLQSGGTVEILVTYVDGDHAKFRVLGPVPGF